MESSSTSDEGEVNETASDRMDSSNRYGNHLWRYVRLGSVIMMSMHDRYYEPEDDDSDLLDERVAELMKEDYDPTEYAHFAEGISEAKKEDCQAVEDILKQPTIDYEALGRKLFCMAYDYMEKRSISEVQDGY